MAFDLFSLPKERLEVLKQVYFDRYVDKKGPNDCWNWTGGFNGFGYGRFYKNIGNKTHAWGAHRLAWGFKYNHPVPEDLDCCHSCDNTRCVNPAHLYIGPHSQNMLDLVLKRRANLLPPRRKSIKVVCKKKK